MLCCDHMADPIVPPIEPVAPQPTEPNPQPEPSSPHSRIGPLIGILVIILMTCALLFFRDPLIGFFRGQPSANNPTTTPKPSALGIPVTQPTTIQEATSSTLALYATSTPSTTPSPTSTPYIPENTTSTIAFGDTAQLFLNDTVIFQDPKNPTRRFQVTALEFTDSRCKPGNTCIWQGELGVRLRVGDVCTTPPSGEPAPCTSTEVNLGMVRAKTATAFGLNLQLNEIDEGKGGTFASLVAS